MNVCMFYAGKTGAHSNKTKPHMNIFTVWLAFTLFSHLKAFQSQSEAICPIWVICLYFYFSKFLDI